MTTTLLKFLRIEQEIDLEIVIQVSDLHEGEEHGSVGGSGCKFWYLLLFSRLDLHSYQNELTIQSRWSCIILKLFLIWQVFTCGKQEYMDDNLHIVLSLTRSATYKVEFLSFSETIHFVKEFM